MKRKPKRFKITCPLCGRTRLVGREIVRKIEVGLVTGQCRNCFNSSQKILQKDYFLTCPDCGETRAVSKAMHKRFETGGTNGVCRSCACAARNKARAVKNIEREAIECCGCKLYEDKQGGRCERFFDCAFNDECLSAVAKMQKMWDGFTADCRGFRKKEFGY